MRISNAARHEFIQGVKVQLPILLGVVPLALIFGALAISAGIPPIAVQGYSLFVFAGSAQFLAVGLINSGATAVVVVLSIFISHGSNTPPLAA